MHFVPVFHNLQLSVYTHSPVCLIYCPDVHSLCSTANAQESLFSLMQWDPSFGSQIISAERVQAIFTFKCWAVDKKTKQLIILKVKIRQCFTRDSASILQFYISLPLS